jgi:antitoxin (DNA-binding transcriptional repressor) of toxin-antitoxin stability system
MKQQYNIAEAKSHFSELVKRALLGEDIVIARDNKPILRLAPVIEGRRRKERLPVTVRFPVHVDSEAHALKSSPCAFGCPNYSPVLSYHRKSASMLWNMVHDPVSGLAAGFRSSGQHLLILDPMQIISEFGSDPPG